LGADTLHINNRATAQNTFDAIVIGSGISGGWAAKELCEKGLKTLVLERGRNVEHIKDYPTATKAPWEFAHRGELKKSIKDENPVVSKCYAFDEAGQHFFVKDKEHPYIQEKPFDWIRGYQVGGKSIMWGRQTQRFSRFEFEAPARDGFAVDWPIRYEDMAPWYSYAELFAGISGNKDGLEHLPDGEFLPPWDLNCVEDHVRQSVAKNYKGRYVLKGRCAHLTKPTAIHLQQGRGTCQARSLCERGCPFGGYFNTNSTTLPWAAKTGNLTLRPHSVVHSIIYDAKKGRAAGVNITDAQTRQQVEYYARIIFVNAACLNTNLLLLNSTSVRFPNGLGNDNGLMGRYIAFQNYRGRVTGTVDGFEDSYYYGRRPTEVIMPTFRNVYKQEAGLDFMRGYMVFMGAWRSSLGGVESAETIGAGFKTSIAEPGKWNVYMTNQGETIPRYENHVRLSKDKTDEWGMPQLITSVGYTDNDEKQLKDFITQASEMMDKAGCKNLEQFDTKQAPGLDIHEVGGVRMGKDPKTSLLNRWNQLHTCSNVFVTDGACMTSTGYQNPSLTYMAITARAANYAVEELKKGQL
jgi:choline dehydrogenase-like flavoprotein